MPGEEVPNKYPQKTKITMPSWSNGGDTHYSLDACLRFVPVLAMAILSLPCCFQTFRVFNVAGQSVAEQSVEKHGMLASEIAEACSWVSRRSYSAQAWNCREGALAVRVLRDTLRNALHSALRDILHSYLL